MKNVQWKKVKLGDCLTIGNGCDYKHLKEGDIPVFGTGGIMAHVDGYLYDGETVCIGRKGTINHPIYHNGKIWTVDTLFYTHSFIDVIPKFVYYAFCNIDWNKYNEATGVPSLSKETIYKIEISVPSLPAQRRIAAILSAADKVIEQTRQLISKYKSIKQGMMEDLLKPKEGWKKVKLGEVGDFYVGGDVDKSCFSPYQTPECKYPIYANALVDEGLYGYSSKYEFDKEAVTITGRGDVGKAFYRKPYFSTIIRLVTLIPRDSDIDVKFLSYAMSRINFIIESTGVPQLTAPQAKKYGVFIPYKNDKPDIVKQRRIAKILSGIDKKIEAEEKVLEKYGKMKKGLMEKLLNN